MDLEKITVGNAAGTARTIEDVRRLASSAVTRITVGSITKLSRSGNSGSTYYFDEATRTSLNSIGIRNEGLDWYHSAGKLYRMSEIAHESGKELWASVAGFSPAEFAELTETAFLCGVDGIELNLGCPNIHDGGVSKPIYSYHPEMVEEVLDHMEQFAFQRKKIDVKLSPVEDAILKKLLPVINLSTVVTGIVAVNTLPNQDIATPEGHAISYVPQGDVGMRHAGGMAGAPLLPHGVRVVKKLRDLSCTLPIIGVGGIFSGQDAKEYLDAGAAGFECGTAYYNYENPSIFSDIIVELAGLYAPA